MTQFQMSKEDHEKIKELRGLVATVVTGPMVAPDYARFLSNMRDFNTRAGLQVEYRQFSGVFVSMGRELAAKHALKEDYDFMLMVDADAAPFPPFALAHLLRDLFIRLPQDAALVGAYAQLKSSPHIPTIDTGTGKWEPHFPGSGIIEVMRTGGHFALVRVPHLKVIPRPWFDPKRTRTPLRLMQEMDNFVRRNLDGRNPFADNGDWNLLMNQAHEAETRRLKEGIQRDFVGEDTAFVDRLRAAGMKAFVDTDLVAGHVTSKTITPQDLKDAMDKNHAKKAACCGVIE